MGDMLWHLYRRHLIEAALKGAPLALGVVWIWWVLGNFKRDMEEFRETDDSVRKAMILSAWAVTPLVVALIVWWTSVLARYPRIGFE